MALNLKKVKRYVYLSFGSTALLVLIMWGGLYICARYYQSKAGALILATQVLSPGTASYSDAMQVANNYRAEVNYYSGPCTSQRCDFEIKIRNWLDQLSFFHANPHWEPSWEAWVAGLACSVGLRPVTTGAHVEVRNGMVVRWHTGYMYRTRDGGYAGASVTAVKGFSISDKCQVSSKRWDDVELMGINMTTDGGGQEIQLAYPMTATPETIKRASEIDVSCMTRVPECENTPYSILPLANEIMSESKDVQERKRNPEMVKKCESLTNEEQNQYAFGSVD